MSLLKSGVAVGALTMVSRIFGFVRDILIARYLGAGLAADCFFVALKLPNFFRRLFAEGAFTAAFVPMLSRALTGPSGAVAATRLASQALSLMLPILLALTILAELAMPGVIWGLTGGFPDDPPEKAALAVHLTRITFPYLLLISLVSLLTGVANARGRFAAAAAAPIFLNLTLISAILLFHETPMMSAEALAFGVAIAGCVQLVWLIWNVRKIDIDVRLMIPRISPEMKQMLKAMLPIAIGAGAMQVNLLVDIVLATRYLPEGSLSYLFYADRLNQLPLGVVGIAIGTVLLPTLSSLFSKGEREAAATTLNRAVEGAIAMALPAAAALIVIGGPIIGVLFVGRAFTAADGTATAYALGAYATGLPAYVLIKVLTPVFFAKGDTKTPVKLSMIALVLNVILNLILMQFLAHVGLALATAISAWVNAGALMFVAFRRGEFRPDIRFFRTIAALVLSVGVMIAVLFSMARYTYLAEVPWQGPAAIMPLALLIAAGLLSYSAAVQAFRAYDLRSLLRRSS
ncbi:MAG: murein biosynthesis integral membrane protein MurJ [Pseudomonadota bacterium]